MKDNTMQSRVRRVLSIDGGGIRGILPALFLQAIEKKAQKSTKNLFDLVVGTSTGGLIALAMTHPNKMHTPEEILNIYITNAEKIFGKPRNKYLSVLSKPKYSNTGLRDICELIFGKGRLSEFDVCTAVTAYDVKQLRPVVLKSWEAKKNKSNNGFDCFMWQAALATSAAPTYFPAVEIGDHAFVDGGVFANNPSVIALSEAKRMWPGDEIVLVSLGTGISNKVGHLSDEVNSWGGLNWLEPLINIMFDGSSDSVDDTVKKLIGAKNYFRFQVDLNPELASMDKCEKAHLEKLTSAGSKAVHNQNDKIEDAVLKLTTGESTVEKAPLLDQSKIQILPTKDSYQIVKIPDEAREDLIRCSFSALINIEVGGLYLLVRGSRLKHQFQPVGGVLKRLPPSMSDLQNLRVVDDDKMPVDEDSRNDLRVRVPARNIQAFFDWFQSRNGREIEPWREFYEELIVTGILNQSSFPFASFSFRKTHITEVRWSEFMNCYELLVAEVFTLHPNQEQIINLVETQKLKDDRFKWVTQEEIFQRGLTSGVATIAPTAGWIL